MKVNKRILSNIDCLFEMSSVHARAHHSSFNTHTMVDNRFPSPMCDQAVDHHRLDHHYCLSINLQSLRNLRLTHSTYLYCRYVYPYLGTSTPIQTNPPLHIPYTTSTPPNEHLLPHGNCLFNFAVNSEQLSMQFQREPLTIEVYVHDHERNEVKDQLFGLATVRLDQVLKSEKQRSSSTVDGIVGWRQTCTQILPVINDNNEYDKHEHIRWSLTVRHAYVGNVPNY
jgi:hypothetical protein